MKVSLKAARINAGMTQQEVCKKMNISNKTLVSWESCETFPKVTQAMDLCDLYGMSIDDVTFLPNDSL